MFISVFIHVFVCAFVPVFICSLLETVLKAWKVSQRKPCVLHQEEKEYREANWSAITCPSMKIMLLLCNSVTVTNRANKAVRYIGSSLRTKFSCSHCYFYAESRDLSWQAPLVSTFLLLPLI